MGALTAALYGTTDEKSAIAAGLAWQSTLTGLIKVVGA
jgi:hypothetical protein